MYGIDEEGKPALHWQQTWEEFHMMDAARAQDEDEVLYVEELEGPDDYWLSITDAARVCRVQDVSIRRAIKRKSLAVRRQRAGQNKRTRFVRASDLARAGFPIIDESAMITTEIGKVDVLSIPRQQQQIVQEHQALLLQVEETRETLSNYQRETTKAFDEQEKRTLDALQSAQDAYTRQLASVKETVLQQQEQFQHMLAKTAREHIQVEQNLRQELAQVQVEVETRAEQAQAVSASLRYDLTQVQAAAHKSAEHFQAVFDTLQATLREQQAETKQQLQYLAATQQNALATYQQAIDASLQRSAQTFHQRLLELEQRLAIQTQGLTHRLSQQEQTLAQMQQSQESFQQRNTARDQEIARELQRQQKQLEYQEHTLHQRILIEQEWSQKLSALETQQHEFERYRPFFALLDTHSPERLETLLRQLLPKEASGPETGVE